MGEFEEQVTISAPAEKVWDALADIGNIYVWNPGVVHSEQTTPGDVGMGACRRCNVGGKNYLHEGEETPVTVSPNYQLKFGLLWRFLDWVMVRAAYRKGMGDLLRGLKEHTETRPTS